MEKVKTSLSFETSFGLENPTKFEAGDELMFLDQPVVCFGENNTHVHVVVTAGKNKGGLIGIFKRESNLSALTHRVRA